MISPHPTNLVITALAKLVEAASALLCKLFPEDTDFTDFAPRIPDSRYYLSEADCFYDVKVETLLSFVIEAYNKVGSYDETNWKTLCATLSDEAHKSYFAGQKCTDILSITDTRATWDSTNKEYDFSNTQVIGRIVFGYLRLPNLEDTYKMSYWLTIDNGAHWYDLQDSTATPIEGVINLS